MRALTLATIATVGAMTGCAFIAEPADAQSNDSFVGWDTSRELFQLADNSADCSAVVLNPNADRDTMQAALEDAGAIVADSGCVHLRFDSRVDGYELRLVVDGYDGSAH